MNKIKQLVITSVVAFLVVIGIGGTAHAARTDMLDVSDYNNNGHALTTQQFVNLRNNYGIKAVTVKISEGQTWNASTARDNISDASQAGLYTNGYHFARYNSVATAQAEARHAVQQAQVDGLGIGSVIVTDAESSAQSGVSKETNDQANQAFAQVVQQAGYRCDIYTMGSWVNTKMTVADGAGWIAYYPYHVTTDRYTGNHAWQFSSTMTFIGLAGRYDVSQLYDNYYTANTDKNAVISNAQTTHVAINNKHTATHKQTVSGTFRDGPYIIHRQTGVFTAGQTLRVFSYPGVQSTGAKYYKGESVIYDGYVRNGNYIYVSYLTKTGHHHYIAVRSANTRVPLGMFK